MMRFWNLLKLIFRKLDFLDYKIHIHDVTVAEQIYFFEKYFLIKIEMLKV